ncbi:uncharacterized protein LOC135812797 [Sycon ciliatum]|uniref:uncharacterized protein LOC135812797 n=1 Tax=Sycon ciliatum TaxID=27933 RepID=UPI0031F5F69B
MMSSIPLRGYSKEFPHCRRGVMQYRVYSHFLSYEAATQFCFEKRGELAQPLTKSLNSCLAATINIIEKNGYKSGTNFWLGIKGDADMKQWWYVDSEDEIGYSNWADVDTKRKYGGCGVLLLNQTGHWGSEDCNKPHRFICQSSRSRLRTVFNPRRLAITYGAGQQTVYSLLGNEELPKCNVLSESLLAPRMTLMSTKGNKMPVMVKSHLNFQYDLYITWTIINHWQHPYFTTADTGKYKCHFGNLTARDSFMLYVIERIAWKHTQQKHYVFDSIGQLWTVTLEALGTVKMIGSCSSDVTLNTSSTRFANLPYNATARLGKIYFTFRGNDSAILSRFSSDNPIGVVFNLSCTVMYSSAVNCHPYIPGSLYNVRKWPAVYLCRQKARPVTKSFQVLVQAPGCQPLHTLVMNLEPSFSSSNKRGAIVQPKCISGLSIVNGFHNVECLPNGLWSGLPECEDLRIRLGNSSTSLTLEYTNETHAVPVETIGMHDMVISCESSLPIHTIQSSTSNTAFEQSHNVTAEYNLMFVGNDINIPKLTRAHPQGIRFLIYCTTEYKVNFPHSRTDKFWLVNRAETIADFAKYRLSTSISVTLQAPGCKPLNTLGSDLFLNVSAPSNVGAVVNMTCPPPASLTNGVEHMECLASGYWTTLPICAVAIAPQRSHRTLFIALLVPAVVLTLGVLLYGWGIPFVKLKSGYDGRELPSVRLTEDEAIEFVRSGSPTSCKPDEPDEPSELEEDPLNIES